MGLGRSGAWDATNARATLLFRRLDRAAEPAPGASWNSSFPQRSVKSLMLRAAEYAAMRALQTWWEEEGAKDLTKFSSVDTGQCTRVLYFYIQVILS